MANILTNKFISVYTKLDILRTLKSNHNNTLYNPNIFEINFLMIRIYIIHISHIIVLGELRII